MDEMFSLCEHGEIKIKCPVCKFDKPRKQYKEE